jgi:hypothetical protein
MSPLFFTGCTKTPTITEISSDESFEGLHYENILVIGATTKITFRNLLEGKLTKQLQDHGLSTLPSYGILPYSSNLTRQTVLNAVEKSGTEGVLFICLIESGEKDTFDSIGKSNLYDYYEGLQKIMTGTSESGTRDEQKFFLTSGLYDAKTEKQIWSLTTESDFKYKITSLNEAVSLVIKQLQASGLI